MLIFNRGVARTIPDCGTSPSSNQMADQWYRRRTNGIDRNLSLWANISHASSATAYEASAAESPGQARASKSWLFTVQGNASHDRDAYCVLLVGNVTILAPIPTAGVLPAILRGSKLEPSCATTKCTKRRVRELASSLTRNQVPRKGLGVRVPCPPLLCGDNGGSTTHSLRANL